jgi:hypothetical protein
MPLAQNLAYANGAVAHARTLLDGSSNKISDRINAAPGGIDAIIAARTGFDTTLINDVTTMRADTARALSYARGNHLGTIHSATRQCCDRSRGWQLW